MPRPTAQFGAGLAGFWSLPGVELTQMINSAPGRLGCYQLRVLLWFSPPLAQVDVEAAEPVPIQSGGHHVAIPQTRDRRY